MKLHTGHTPKSREQIAEKMLLAWFKRAEMSDEEREIAQDLVAQSRACWWWRHAGGNGVAWSRGKVDGIYTFATPEEAFAYGCQIDPRWIGREEEAGL